MTIKRNQILEAALQLFSEDGYHATSTSKVAKKANVSEGLIFRHFKSKEGLLEVALQKIADHLNELLSNILDEEDSKEILLQTLELPFTLKMPDIEIWKLHYKLHWELNLREFQVFNSLKRKLVKAFEKLRYRNPELESAFLIHHLDGLMNSILKNEITNKEETKAFLFKKYHLINE